MRRDRELQIKMLKRLRGDEVDHISDQHTEEERAYNAGLLIEEGLADGVAKKASETGRYAYARLTGLTSIGHDFLDQLDAMSAPTFNAQDEFQMAIFISHSSSDRELASELATLFQLALALPAEQIRCTSVNGYRLPTGADTDEQLRQEVRTSRILIGLVTPTSLTSTYVLFELGARWGAKLPLFPVLGCGINSSALRGPLGSINALDLADVSQVHQLLGDVAKALGKQAEAPSALTKQIDKVVQMAIKKSAPIAISSTSPTILVDKDSNFRTADPASHILRAIALLGEEAYSIDEIQQKSGEPILKVRFHLNLLIELSMIELIEFKDSKKYRLTPNGLLDAVTRLL